MLKTFTVVVYRGAMALSAGCNHCLLNARLNVQGIERGGRSCCCWNVLTKFTVAVSVVPWLSPSQLDSTASPEEVKRVLRSVTLRWHPVRSSRMAFPVSTGLFCDGVTHCLLLFAQTNVALSQDKFQQSFGPHLHPDHSERILDRVNALTSGVNWLRKTVS